jgi:hypothetical protein
MCFAWENFKYILNSLLGLRFPKIPCFSAFFPNYVRGPESIEKKRATKTP